ncbi:MAG: DNA-directed RNA polymerase [Pseudomonadota bacterium]
MENTLRLPADELASIYGEEALKQEIKLENNMVTLGRDQVRKAVERARQGANESGTDYGKTLIARSVERVSSQIVEFIEASKAKGRGRRAIAVRYLERVSPDVAAYIALRLVVDSLTGKKHLLQRVFVQIGRRIEDEVRFAEFKETDARAYNYALLKASAAPQYHRKKNTIAGYERRFKEEAWQAWPEQDCLHIGAALVDMIVNIGIVTVGEEIINRKNTKKVLEPTAQLIEWIENEVSRSELLNPTHMPMVVPPLPWTDPFNGGYLTQDAQGRAALVKTGNINYLTELADDVEQMPMVYDSINALQNTRWSINNDVLWVMQAIWDHGHNIAGLPSREDISICPCPKCGANITLTRLNTRGKEEHACFEDEEVLREWKREAHKLHSENVSTRSRRLALAKTLRIAETYKDHTAIYFPYQLDFRGRIYAIPTFNPQGADHTKGLLKFADAKPIEDGVAAGWLAIHGANVFGYDKASLEDRIGWVEDNEQDILDCAENPLSNTWWAEADKPWQFLAFCMEWSGFVREGYGFMSSLAVALDGSCSGIQHFSAMLRDEVGASAVNLIPADKPSDIYQMVCDRSIQKLSELTSTIVATAEENSPSSPQGGEEASAISLSALSSGEEKEVFLAEGWLKLGLDRSATKRQVMTLPYGSTKYSCREYTDEWMKKQSRKGKTLPWEESDNFTSTRFMSEIIWDSINDVVKAAPIAMGWLQKCAKVVAHEELPVYWNTPVGFRVMQHYKNTSSRRVWTKMGERVIKLSLSEEKKTTDKRRMANAISPNFVHSMDATHLVMSVCYATDNGVSHFAMIHDSFGSHAADTAMLAACLRKAFVDLYSDTDVLEDFRDQIVDQVDPEQRKLIPQTPAKGELNIAEVEASDFFFA